MTFEPGEAGRRAVAKHGDALALLSDHAYDALTDELACEDPERRTRGLHASPSKHIASKLRAEATNPSVAGRFRSSGRAGLVPGTPVDQQREKVEVVESQDTQSRYTITRTGLASLPPVTLTIRQGNWSFHDFMTCEEAELLAGMLRARARQVREERERAREQVMSDLEVLSRAARTPFTPTGETA